MVLERVLCRTYVQLYVFSCMLVPVSLAHIQKVISLKLQQRIRLFPPWLRNHMHLTAHHVPCHCPVTSIWPQLEQLPEVGFWPYFLLIITWDCLNSFSKYKTGSFHFLYIAHTHTHMLFNLCIWILLFQLQSKLDTIACKLYKSLGRDCIWRQSKWHFSAK